MTGTEFGLDPADETGVPRYITPLIRALSTHPMPLTAFHVFARSHGEPIMLFTRLN